MAKSSETWDQGGISRLTDEHQIEAIQVTEMSKEDFSLLEDHEDRGPLEYIQTAQEFWQRLTNSLPAVFSSAGEQEDEIDDPPPDSLAERITWRVMTVALHTSEGA